MLTLTAIPTAVNSDFAPALVPCSDDAPAEFEPMAPCSAADAAWWASQSTGGCHPVDLSPEDRLIAAAMTAMEFHLDQCGEFYRTLDRIESGLALW